MKKTHICFILIFTWHFLRELGIIFVCCELSPGLLPVVLLDPEVRFYRGRARVSFVEKRHEGAVHSGSLRGTGARAHDDADSYQQDGHAYGAQHHWDGPDIGDNFFSSGVSWLDGASEGTQYRP